MVTRRCEDLHGKPTHYDYLECEESVVDKQMHPPLSHTGFKQSSVGISKLATLEFKNLIKNSNSIFYSVKNSAYNILNLLCAFPDWGEIEPKYTLLSSFSFLATVIFNACNRHRVCKFAIFYARIISFLS